VALCACILFFKDKIKSCLCRPCGRPLHPPFSFSPFSPSFFPLTLSTPICIYLTSLYICSHVSISTSICCYHCFHKKLHTTNKQSAPKMSIAVSRKGKPKKSIPEKKHEEVGTRPSPLSPHERFRRRRRCLSPPHFSINSDSIKIHFKNRIDLALPPSPIASKTQACRI
jgi:hypothetical protein